MNILFSDFFEIDELKAHCRIDFDDDNPQLEAFAEAAIELCQTHTGGTIIKKGVSLEEYLTEKGISFSKNSKGEISYDNRYWLLEFNKRIRAAALLVVGDLYENRSAETDYQTYENRAFNLLLNGMRNINIIQVGG